MYHYKNVSASVVEPDLRVRAETATALAAAELALGHVSIQWYKSVSSAGESSWSAERPEMGHAEALSPSQIWLNIDQSPQQAAVTAAHELQHIEQYRSGKLPRYELLVTKDIRRNTEFEAERFGQAIAYRMATGSDEPVSNMILRREPDEAELLLKEATRLLKVL